MEILLTTQDVAESLGIHHKSIYRLVKEKRIPFIKKEGVGLRFREKDIEDWLNKGKNETVQMLESFPKFEPKIENYDKIFLKGGSALSKKSKRWNYGIGAIYVRKTKQGKERWYIDYRNEEGKRIQRVVKNAQSREEATLALQKAVLDVFSRENDIKPKQKKIKFQEYADMYLENYAKSNKRSWKTDEYYLKGIKRFFNNLYLDEISPLHIEKYKAERSKQSVQPSTVNRCLAIIRKMFNLAVDWGFLEKNQIGKVKLFSEKDNLKERILTKEEEKRLLEVSSDHLQSIITVALNTGMRIGEILNLQWNQVDLQAKNVKVEKTKSGKIRLISINTPLLQELQKLKEKNHSSEYVFVNPKTGKPFNSVKTAFKAACRRSNITNLRFHDLRHTFASRLIGKGVDLITVKELLGHSSVKITERYTHSNHEQKKKAVELLAQKHEKKAKKLEDLLHICDTEKTTEKEKLLKSLFSVN